VQAGLYGKLPDTRDFLRRGLPNNFVVPWDNWLARVLAASQAEIGEAWLNAYLTSPPWRFALDPNLLGETGWLGVLVSSVDSLHRCFPLTLAAPCPEFFSDGELSFDSEGWTAQAESLALAMIDAGGSVDAGLVQFKDIAGAIATPGRYPPAARSPVFSDAYELPDNPAGAGRSEPEAHAFSYWWHGDWPGHPAIALRCRGLPDAALCASFFDAGWAERGLIRTPPPRAP
jgi:type VI secretion system protein ImpM